MRRLFTISVATISGFFGLVLGLTFAYHVLNLHDGDENKTWSVAVLTWVTFAVGTAVVASKAFTRISAPRQPIVAIVSFLMAATLFYLFLAGVIH